MFFRPANGSHGGGILTRSTACPVVVAVAGERARKSVEKRSHYGRRGWRERVRKNERVTGSTRVCTQTGGGAEGLRGSRERERAEKNRIRKSNNHRRAAAAEKNDGKKRVIYKNNIVGARTRYLPCRRDRCTVIPDGVPSTPAPALAHLCAPPLLPPANHKWKAVLRGGRGGINKNNYNSNNNNIRRRLLSLPYGPRSRWMKFNFFFPVLAQWIFYPPQQRSIDQNFPPSPRLCLGYYYYYCFLPLRIFFTAARHRRLHANSLNKRARAVVDWSSPPTPHPSTYTIHDNITFNSY